MNMDGQLYRIRCPECSFGQEVRLLDKLDAAAQPELKQQLLENRFNRVGCEDCGFSFRADLAVLYSDLPRGIIIHWIPLHHQSFKELQRDFESSRREMERMLPPGAELPRLQLALSRVELLERIFLLEQGFDERIIEYIKHTVYQKNAGALPVEQYNLLFNAQDSTEEELLFAVMEIDSGQPVNLLRYPRALYDRLRREFKKDPAPLEALFPGVCKNARLSVMEKAGA